MFPSTYFDVLIFSLFFFLLRIFKHLTWSSSLNLCDCFKHIYDIRQNHHQIYVATYSSYSFDDSPVYPKVYADSLFEFEAGINNLDLKNSSFSLINLFIFYFSLISNLIPFFLSFFSNSIIWHYRLQLFMKFKKYVKLFSLLFIF